MVVEERCSKNQFVDPEVAKVKFEIQWNLFENREQEYRDQGIVCIKKAFPFLEFAFLSPSLKLSINDRKRPQENIVFQAATPWVPMALRFDYTNFDILPPSIRLIDPISRKEVFTSILKMEIYPNQQNLSKLPAPRFKVKPQPILLPDLDGRLFICLPGIREYHQHLQHDGDSWFLYRNNDNGKLTNLLDKIFLYSVTNYHVNIKLPK